MVKTHVNVQTIWIPDWYLVVIQKLDIMADISNPFSIQIVQKLETDLFVLLPNGVRKLTIQ